MRQATVTIPVIGIIAATRGMLGFGAGMLLANRMSDKRRSALGWPFLLLGIASTVPLAVDVVRKSKPCDNVRLG